MNHRWALACVCNVLAFAGFFVFFKWFFLACCNKSWVALLALVSLRISLSAFGRWGNSVGKWVELGMARSWMFDARNPVFILLWSVGFRLGPWSACLYALSQRSPRLFFSEDTEWTVCSVLSLQYESMAVFSPCELVAPAIIGCLPPKLASGVLFFVFFFSSENDLLFPLDCLRVLCEAAGIPTFPRGAKAVRANSWQAKGGILTFKRRGGQLCHASTW